MQQLVEKVFEGRWKSFKVFRHSGEVKMHGPQRYTEFEFSEDRRLLIRNFQDRQMDVLAQTSKWSVEFKNKKHFLSVKDAGLNFEVITINHTVMVLQEL